jgi:hypothetical protein
MSSSFWQTGGARIGWKNVTVPFATLSASREALRISCFGKDHTFPRDMIEGVSRHRGIFSIGLRVHHTVPVYPDFIAFWVSLIPWGGGRRFAALKEKLESLGYRVAG